VAEEMTTSLEKQLATLEQRVMSLEVRNQRVEAAKRWETSRIRYTLIALLTYAVMILIFVSLKSERPLADAIVPTMGFVLSTASLRFMERWMITVKK
jgi:hypothetical protein